MEMMKEMQNFRFLELEERVLKAEESYIDLESKMQNRNKEFESLELRFKEMESEKLVVEQELKKLKESSSEEESLIDQMMVNEALEVEKHVAEKEAEEWKRKFEKLVEIVRKLDEIGVFRVGEFEFDENLKLGLELASIKFPVGTKKNESCKACKDDLSREGLANHQISGSPYITTPVKDYMSGRNRDNVSSRRRVNKMLVFEGDGRIDISDSETEERKEKECDGLEETSIGEEYEDEDVEACEVDTNATLPSRKRKRVIASDSENDDDDDEDNIPIATLKNLKPKNQDMSDLVIDTPSIGENESGGLRRQRRVSSRLRKQRDLEETFTASERIPTERLVGIPVTGNVEDDETEEESERESESESLDGFIVDDELVSEESDDTEGDVPDEESDGETGYADVISRLRRDKKNPGGKKWEYEADMLAAFGKDPELCMRAVCVLYMFQTEDEKASRSSHVANGRGFSMYDAERGTRIGQFLTDGDPSGDLKKSVEELQSFEYNAVEICEDLARRYSNQLFQIYKNREVPFFAAAPSP